MVENVVFTPIF